jgi:hypothetical protein
MTNLGNESIYFLYLTHLMSRTLETPIVAQLVSKFPLYIYVCVCVCVCVRVCARAHMLECASVVHK